MKVELTSDAAQWVETELAAGRFASPEDAVSHAIQQARLVELRAEIDAAEREGGSFTTQEVRDYASTRLGRLDEPFNAS